MGPNHEMFDHPHTNRTNKKIGLTKQQPDFIMPP